MSEFKIGDKVVCIDQAGGLVKGKSYIISDVYDDTIHLEGVFGSWFTTRFKKEEESMSDFKIGDKVVCIEEVAGSQALQEGKTYTVTGVYKHKSDMLLDLDTPVGRGWLSTRFKKVEDISEEVNRPGHPLDAEFKWEVGKRYRFRNTPGWAEVIYDKSTLDKGSFFPLVIITQAGSVQSRSMDGKISSDDDSDQDILPIEHKEPFKVTKECWLKKSDSATLDYGFLQDFMLEVSTTGEVYTEPTEGAKKYRITVEEIEG